MMKIVSIPLLEKSIWLVFPRRTSFAHLSRSVRLTFGFQQTPWKQHIICTKGKLVLWLTAPPYPFVGAARPILNFLWHLKRGASGKFCTIRIEWTNELWGFFNMFNVKNQLEIYLQMGGIISNTLHARSFYHSWCH